MPNSIILDELIQDISCPVEDVSPVRLILAAEGKMFNPLEFPVFLLNVAFDAYVGKLPPISFALDAAVPFFHFFSFSSSLQLPPL